MNPNPQTVQASLHNAGAVLQNVVAALPGRRPEGVVLELSGSYPARKSKRKLLSVPPQVGPRDTSLEELQGAGRPSS